MFEGLLANVLILLASIIILDKASDWTVANSVRVAQISGFGKTAVGFMLMAFATSLPELSVSIFAAIGQESIGVAIGNALGSNIVDVCLILGLCFIMAALKNPDCTALIPAMSKEDLGSLYFGLFVASIIPLTLLYIGYASRFIGVVLLAIFILYIYQRSKLRNVKEKDGLGGGKEKLGKYVSLTVLGAGLVVAGSYFIVDSASYLAESVGIPKVVIGATIVAFGTSIPELATSLDAVRKGHLDLALGNIVGSCFVNITCILGIALAASTLTVNMAAFSALVTFTLITNLLLWYFLSSEKIGWKEGAVLLFMYFIFLTSSFGGKEK